MLFISVLQPLGSMAYVPTTTVTVVVGMQAVQIDANHPPRLIPSLLPLTQPLDFIFYKILPALNIMKTVDFLFLPKAAHLFIYLLLKPLLSKLLTQPSDHKKNSCTA